MHGTLGINILYALKRVKGFCHWMGLGRGKERCGPWTTFLWLNFPLTNYMLSPLCFPSIWEPNGTSKNGFLFFLFHSCLIWLKSRSVNEIDDILVDWKPCVFGNIKHLVQCSLPVWLSFHRAQQIVFLWCKLCPIQMSQPFIASSHCRNCFFFNKKTQYWALYACYPCIIFNLDIFLIARSCCF